MEFQEPSFTSSRYSHTSDTIFPGNTAFLTDPYRHSRKMRTIFRVQVTREALMTLLETHRRAFRQSVPGYGQRNQALQKLEQASLRHKNDPLLDKCDTAQIVRDKQGELQWIYIKPRRTITQLLETASCYY